LNIQHIIVVFKTHLDIGFTDFAGEVVRRYNEVYIPRAIAVGEAIAASGRAEGFVWTTGSWLVHQYLRQAGPQERLRAENAIKAGILRWHALPFTMHSECANADLYRYGLSLSRELDEAFGVKTISAKNTDVPGHTRAIVPLLREAGVDFLHIGVNAASMPPDVPELFRWQAAGGDESVNVMYAKGDYGEFSVLPGTGTAVCFAHTGDNLGPQSAREIFKVYDGLRREYPDATIRAGSLNEVAQAVAGIAGTLPVITQEIGDSWIHGMGTDPRKMSQYRALLRLAEGWDEQSRRALYRRLVLIPEHTWGLDEKTHLRDNSHYSREEFDVLRGEANYRKMEASWQEQRDYITQAVAALEPTELAQAAMALTEYRVGYPCLDGYEKMGNQIAKNGWDFTFDSHGAITGLQRDGVIYADKAHRLCDFLYEAFSEKEVLAFGERYQPRAFDWGLEDQGKIGLAPYMDRYRAYRLTCGGVYENEESILLLLSSNEEAAGRYGCPPECTLIITPEEGRVLFDFAWYAKPVLRIPEALWLGFCLTGPLTGIQKLGSMIDPLDVISNGNREMHCTEGPLQFDGVRLHTLDAPLVAVEKPSCYAFHNQLPDTGKGVWFNLFNNQWGTNFPMWNEGDARFRFVMERA